MSDLYLCLDPGGSQTKIIYQLRGDKSPRFFLMSPEVEQISQSQLNSYLETLGWIGSPTPASQAWLKVKQNVFVVGAMANKFDPDDRLQELKYENALYKVLAAVGVVVQQTQLSTRKKLGLQLAILLPWNEYSDRKRFQRQLELFLRDFSFRGQSLKVKLEKFVCRPEGGGLAAIRILQKGIQWLQGQRLGVLMLGHRNTTALYFESGELKSGDSPLIGFSQLLDLVVQRTSGLDRDSLAEALFQSLNRLIQTNFRYGSTEQETVYQIRSNGRQHYWVSRIHPQWQELAEIQSLATAKDPSLRFSEIKDLSLAIQLATQSYGEKLKKWLKRSFPQSLDEVIISGGAARFLEPELEQYFNCCLTIPASQRYSFELENENNHYQAPQQGRHLTRIVWGSGIHPHLTQVFQLNGTRGREKSLCFRLTDAYGLFDYLIALN